MNVSFDTVELLYWTLGTSLLTYLLLHLFRTLIGNKW